jgi:hypothetical protein
LCLGVGGARSLFADRVRQVLARRGNCLVDTMLQCGVGGVGHLLVVRELPRRYDVRQLAMLVGVAGQFERLMVVASILLVVLKPIRRAGPGWSRELSIAHGSRCWRCARATDLVEDCCRGRARCSFPAEWDASSYERSRLCF